MAFRAKSRTVRAVLALFAMCLVVPAMLAIGVMVTSNVLEVRRSKEAELLAVAQSASKAVDLKMTRIMTIADAIASSDTVVVNDWEAARTRIERLGLGPDVWVAVSDQAGRRLLNTNPNAPAQAAPRLPRPEGVAAAARSSSPVISNLFTGWSTGRKVVSVDRGVRDSATQTVVTVVADPRTLIPTAEELPVPKGAIITVVDRQHRVIARSRNHDRWQGAMSTAPMVAALRRETQGVVASRSLDGDPTAVAFKTSPLTGWTTMVVVPRRTVVGPAVTNGIAFAVLASALLAFGIGLSRLFGKALIRDLHLLEDDAAAVGHGRQVALRPGGIENIDRVQATLSAAARELEVRASRQQLMINELNHRVKNTLATVQSLAVQTFRRAGPDAPAKFDRRLVALAEAHDLLTKTSWSPVDIRSVVERCAESSSDNVAWTGPSSILQPQTAVALCMCLHELLTNAMKYGALSVRSGLVRIAWTSGEDGAIDLVWREENGPQVTPPASQGFGTKLVDRLARSELGGEVHRHFATSGLSVRLRIVPASTDRWSNDFA